MIWYWLIGAFVVGIIIAKFIPYMDEPKTECESEWWVMCNNAQTPLPKNWENLSEIPLRCDLSNESKQYAESKNQSGKVEIKFFKRCVENG